MSFMIGSNINIANVRRSGGGGASYLLDTYSALAAYSLRQLSSTATNTLRVRRASDNAELDIGFDAGWLDEAAIATHCGASIGYVVTMYDQSGNGYDATQATAGSQPIIYNGTSVYQLNSKPCLIEQGSSTNLTTGTITPATGAVPNTLFAVGQIDTNKYLVDSAAVGDRMSIWNRATGDGTVRLHNNTEAVFVTGFIAGTQYLFSCLYNDTSSTLRLNGSSQGTATTGTNGIPANIRLMNFGFNTAAGSDFQEAVYFESDMSANFSAIETDINTAFSIY